MREFVKQQQHTCLVIKKGTYTRLQSRSRFCACLDISGR